MFLLLGLSLSGCTPVMMVSGPTLGVSRLTDHVYIAADGTELPLSTWSATDPKAIIIALHGFNDYRHFFHSTAEYLRQRQVFCYAYDQRGFGQSPNKGFWAGSDTYAGDLAEFTRLVQERHPGKPVYLLGESMGGAIIIDAMARPQKPDVAGIILSAPAVWGRQTMPWYQTSLLWTLSHTFPWLTLTGKGVVQVTPSDNIEMLIALGRDPWVIKETRVDAIYGLTNLMDAALDSAEKLDEKILLLYGEKDEIVPAEPTAMFVRGLLNEQADKKTVAYYKNGYHMLLRDLQAPLIWQDIAHWILDDAKTLPSGADRNIGKLVRQSDETPAEQNLLGRLDAD
ncbi:alpha/beta hydrolase [Methylomonas rapida]|uniref:alpha/beta hydrolase n=1 Tax=Methylomonas rapida TaxID=2963939 RepID=UPI002E7721CB|nr:lysophospholipase [Methylomonas rapida]